VTRMPRFAARLRDPFMPEASESQRTCASGMAVAGGTGWHEDAHGGAGSCTGENRAQCRRGVRPASWTAAGAGMRQRVPRKDMRTMLDWRAP
jgi:hypothetical protein